MFEISLVDDIESVKKIIEHEEINLADSESKYLRPDKMASNSAW